MAIGACKVVVACIHTRSKYIHTYTVTRTQPFTQETMDWPQHGALSPSRGGGTLACRSLAHYAQRRPLVCAGEELQRYIYIKFRALRTASGKSYVNTLTSAGGKNIS